MRHRVCSQICQLQPALAGHTRCLKNAGLSLRIRERRRAMVLGGRAPGHSDAAARRGQHGALARRGLSANPGIEVIALCDSRLTTAAVPGCPLISVSSAAEEQAAFE